MRINIYFSFSVLVGGRASRVCRFKTSRQNFQVARQNFASKKACPPKLYHSLVC